jgi:hypothetical protein
MRGKIPWSLLRVATGLIIAVAALHLYDAEPFDPNQVVLGKELSQEEEQWKGREFTSWSVPDAKAMVADYEKAPLKAIGDCRPFTILWLGNSQLNTINQFREGDHISPWWLRQEVSCPDTTLPLGVSLPNANFQEMYLLEEYVTARLPVDVIFLELCFDGLRQDGLRHDFAGLTEPSDEGSLDREPVGRTILETAQALWRNDVATEQNPGLKGFLQQGVENRLDAALAKVSPLWADRDTMQLKFLVDVYGARNSLLGINSSTVRKLIPNRYDRNMQALMALLRLARARRIPVIGYISPLRQDLAPPYDLAEYAQWKGALAKLFPESGAKLISLETLVPSADWGISSRIGDVDFIHFRNSGHRLVAEAMLHYVPQDEH